MDENIQRTFKECILDNLFFWIFSGIAIVLLIISFFLPPTGEISPSTLQGVAEIFGFTSLGAVIKAIDKGKSIEMKHGETSITVRKRQDENIEEEPTDAGNYNTEP